MHIDKSGRLLNSKRLALVLDLDNTLLHCSDHPDAGRWVKKKSSWTPDYHRAHLARGIAQLSSTTPAGASMYLTVLRVERFMCYIYPIAVGLYVCRRAVHIHIFPVFPTCFVRCKVAVKYVPSVIRR